MGKMKTHKGLKKRVKVTGSGKIMRRCCNGSHLLSNKSRKRLRAIKGTAIVTGVKAKHMRTVLGV